MATYIYILSFWIVLTIQNGGNLKPFQESDVFHKQITNLVENTINSGDQRSMMFLLDHGLDVNYQTSRGYSLLVLAVMAEQIEIEKILLNRGAQINIISPDGDTPLTYAFKKGDYKSMTILANEIVKRHK